ncbi:type IV secretion system DNA-binding domain-containing protein [Seohaeicola saemankumensis]|nr:type IV secretory system conjugative DNA transfer family protein [Seohaeicola saemankumensis]MCA0871432.1 type IV secretion system DNA-binding domain-containing protein [Seohaeicola saemankumensis]
MNEANIAFYSSFWGSLVLCFVIHYLAPQLSHDRSIIRLGLVIAFFGCLASSTWSLTGTYERFLSTNLRWKYGDASPPIKKSVERFSARKSRYVGGIGRVATLAAGFWALSVLGSWPQLSVLAPYQSHLGWLSFLTWTALPVWALFTLRELREAIEYKRLADNELKAENGRLRDSDYSARLREQAASPPVEVLSPYTFRAGGEVWKWSDFYKNTAIFGMSGSGKTVCVLNAILDGLIGSSANTRARCSGLILDPKGDFQNKIITLCRKYGRENDLVVLDLMNPKTSVRWNPADSKESALEIAGRFAAVSQTIAESSSDDRIWVGQATELIRNIIVLNRFAKPKSPISLAEIYNAAMRDNVLLDLRKLISNEVFSTSTQVQKMSDYFRDYWIPMPEKTKQSVRLFVSDMLSDFTEEPYDTLFSGESEFTLSEVLDRSLILYVNAPIANLPVISRVICTFIKIEFFHEVLKQERLEKERPSFFLCDEFQSFFTVGQRQGDSDNFERTRQSNHANIVAFQDLNALLKQVSQREHVKSLLTNCATKLFLRNTDEDTNSYSSALFGKQIENLGGTTVSVGRGMRETGGAVSLSSSDQYQEFVKQEEFATLAVPSLEDSVDYAETIGHLAARSNVRMERMRWRVHPIVEKEKP